MTHDETRYPSPDEFKPERFLCNDGSLTSDRMHLGFGWGRRMCVGRYVADASLWIAMASFLAVFSAHKALDDDGMDIPVVPKFSTGIAIHPEEFPCRIVPRFPCTSETLERLTGLAIVKNIGSIIPVLPCRLVLPPLPIVGNVLSLDAARPWLTFNAWRSTYGDIIYARLLNKPVIVINSEEIAKDLFEGRSTIYSDKPQSIVYEPFALDFNIGLMPYGDRWRLHRRMFHQAFCPAEMPTYHALQLRSAHKMLFSLLQDPDNYPSHVNMLSASFLLSIVYDYEVKAENDTILHVVENYSKLAVEALTPGATVVMETFPFLLRLPSWFPGATFKRASVECLNAGHDVKEIPFQYVKERMSTGDAAPCFVTDTLNRTRLSVEDDIVITTAIKETAAVAFGAGFETTTSTLLVFLLAMVLHPEAQAKAHAEIDRVVGKDRLPCFDDRPALPFVEAILRETLRWHPVAPFGVPSATTTSDIYKGYFIPKGVVVFKNAWAMTHDETKYPSPDEFKPERFLHDDGSLTSDRMPLGFGWGRRMCVGRYVADASLWIAMASFLAVFSAHKALDDDGMDIPVVPKFSTGIAIHPEEFPCRIVPRFPCTSETLERLTGLEQS
ncbi:cytochrome P450 [Suillus subalutaceus]|uniref:cytochrome P450 n=1 Tax=Suillus subalutaceus TaxID=48586 RepID=UPI001B86B3C4|nr:cytochrome P450 [Suillus subalutaceus]KAG1842640.1 cytochrome P450 [Suillus subalutaceus]